MIIKDWIFKMLFSWGSKCGPFDEFPDAHERTYQMLSQGWKAGRKETREKFDPNLSAKSLYHWTGNY